MFPWKMVCAEKKISKARECGRQQRAIGWLKNNNKQQNKTKNTTTTQVGGCENDLFYLQPMLSDL